MHFALPPKDSSMQNGMYKPRASSTPRWMRRSRMKTKALWGVIMCGVVLLLWTLLGASSDVPAGTPKVVIVTVMEPKTHTKEYLNTIKENRIEYAKKHGYATFFASETDYNVGDSPKSWAKLPAVRHALKLYPHTEYFWFLHQNALIMNPEISIERDIMHPNKLDQIMLRKQPVVPPESIITTFEHLRGDQIHLVLTQDKDGLGSTNFFIRQGDWARFVLSTWFDPLYRSYNFQRADTHALEHIIQWHPTILSRLAIVPSSIFNSYSRAGSAKAAGNTVYKDGDFVINFQDCDTAGQPKCEAEAEKYLNQWRTIFHAGR